MGGGAVMAYLALPASGFSTWEWIPLAAGLIVIIVIAVAGMAGPGGRGRSSGLGARGRDVRTGLPSRWRTGGDGLLSWG